ncbi:MAG: dihydrodipicolinate reductase C-terminal domain-containing protein [Bacteroidota bacterium]
MIHRKKTPPAEQPSHWRNRSWNNCPTKKTGVNNETDKPEELSIISKRIDPAPGTHSIKYASAIDDIEIIHTAHSRTGFAAGAVLAAEFIQDKKGIFSMKNVLGF